MICKCGHADERHEIEPPYPCYECACQAMDMTNPKDRIALASEFMATRYYNFEDAPHVAPLMADYADHRTKTLTERIKELERALMNAVVLATRERHKIKRRGGDQSTEVWNHFIRFGREAGVEFEPSILRGGKDGD